MTRTLLFSAALLLAFSVSAMAQTPAAVAKTTGQTTVGPNFVDNDGDGICDLYQSGAAGQRAGKGYGRGQGDGTRVGPRDGSGFGAGQGAGVGVCDGTGPKGQARRRGGKR